MGEGMVASHPALKLEAGICFSSWVQNPIAAELEKATSGVGLSLASRQLLPHICVHLLPLYGIPLEECGAVLWSSQSPRTLGPDSVLHPLALDLPT